MTAVTATMVATLRAQTDAPMMECKRALQEAQGDMERAETILQAKLGGRVTKAASRLAAEGAVIALAKDGVGVLVELNCETDFVAKSEGFLSFGQRLAEAIAAQNPSEIGDLAQLSLGDGTVEAARAALVGKVGENVAIRRFERIQTERGLAAYAHNGKIGVLVAYEGEPQVGADLAMHIAAMKPQAVRPEGLPAELVARARALATEKAAQSGKPAEIAEKMIEGGVRKFLKESTLLSQPFVKNDKQTVEQMLAAKGAKIASFALCVAGEGIAKPAAGNFAAEVAAQAAAAAPQKPAGA